MQDRKSTNSASTLINLKLTNAQKTCLFKIEIKKSDHQIKQAAATGNQSEKLQQVAKEKILLEIEYMMKKGDARLAVLNAYQEPAT